MKVTKTDLYNAVDVESLSMCGVNTEIKLFREGFRGEKLGEEINREKDFLKECFEEFQFSCDFLSKCKKRKTPNEKMGSYKLKHFVEKWADMYISNGAFIAAVIHCQIPYKKYNDSPNISVAISSRCSFYKEQAKKYYGY